MAQVVSRPGAIFARSRHAIARLSQRAGVWVLPWQGRSSAVLSEPEAGMSTAEYAIGTIAACAFAALLYKVITSSQILGLLSGLVSRALHVPF